MDPDGPIVLQSGSYSREYVRSLTPLPMETVVLSILLIQP